LTFRGFFQIGPQFLLFHACSMGTMLQITRSKEQFMALYKLSKPCEWLGIKNPLCNEGTRDIALMDKFRDGMLTFATSDSCEFLRDNTRQKI